MKRLVLVVVAAAVLNAAELPVRRVILYKNGVGYFERAGDLAAGESARLDFQPAEMNDVLKSLTVEDRSGAKITGLRYDSSEPLAKKLEHFPFQLDGQKPLSAFLDQMKGARLELKFGAETVSGAIVGARITPGTEKSAEREQVTLLTDAGDIRSFDLSAASTVRFADPELQRQLKEYLAAVAGARSKDKRSVYIDSTDVKARQVIASYMAPSPVWKSSYRLVFGEGEPVLEGWAIVDNTTGEDWTKVTLALVSGRPISFISRLYEPKYAERPVAELHEDRAQGPVVHQGAMAETRMAPSAGLAPPPVMAAPRPQMMRKQAADMAEERLELTSSIAAAAQGRDLGELFEYRFASPVTVRKSESAMLPFLQQKVGARKLLIYSDPSSEHPMSAAELANSTGKTLDGGPITVFDSNAYAGEALMETLKTGDKRLISYGVDLGTRVTTRFDSSRDLVREIHLRRGMLTTRNAMQETRTYTIRNVDQKPKTVIVEHPVRPGYKLLNQKPSETTASAYRFEVKVPAGATEKFPVSEERVYDTTLAVMNQTPDFLLTFIQNKNLGDAAVKQLQRLADQKRVIADNDSALRRTEEQINETARDQERIRQNIDSLNRVSGQQEQVQRYARDLAAQEAALASLRDRQGELRKKKTALESELNALIEKIEF